MTTTPTQQSTPTPDDDKGSAQGRLTLRAVVVTGLFGLATAAVTAVGAVAVGWMQYRGPFSGAQEGDAVPTLIVSPVRGEEVSLCTNVRGIAPAKDDAAYWVVVHGTEDSSPYSLSREVVPNGARSGHWDLGRVQVGAPSEVGYTFELLLVRTEGNLTRQFSDKLNVGPRELGLSLPDDAEELDRVEVTRGPNTSC